MDISRRFYDDQAFMTCIMRVDYQTPRWQKAVRAVLRSSKGVRSFRMDENGMVEVSGMVDPNLLIKGLGKAGRAAELCWFQFGQCSTNLFLSNHHHHHSYNGDGRYFPFRVHQSYYPPPRHLYGYHCHDDYCYLPTTAARRRRRLSSSCGGESAGCCSLM